MSHQEKIIERLINVAREIFQEKKGEVYLYGSQARKDASEFSDWDILVLTEEELGKEESFNKYGFPFCEIGWYLEEDINPLVFSQKEWNAQNQTYFFYTVMQDAIKIYS